MAQYKGSVELISGLTQKNGGDFPLMDAHAIQVDDTGKRLDEKLSEIGTGGSGSGESYGVTPESFGAKGDGVTDDYDAIVAAMSAAASSGKPLVFTKGRTYKIQKTLAFISNLTIEGNDAVILTDIPGMTGSNRNALSLWGRGNDNRLENITIREVTIRASDDCTTNNMMAVARCRNITLSHMTFDCDMNTQSRGCLDLYGVNENILIENCTFRQLSASLEGGIWVRTWNGQVETRNIRFLNCDFLKAGGDEILAVWGWNGTVKDVLISGCTFREIEDPKYWTNVRYRPYWFITLGQSGSAEVQFVNNVVRSTHCECVFRMLGEKNYAVVENCDIRVGQDASVPQHDFKKGANMMLAQGNDDPLKTIIRNCRMSFKGDGKRRLTYRMGAVENCTIEVDGVHLFASTKVVRNNTIRGHGGTMNDCNLISGNTISLIGTFPQMFAGYGIVENNDITISLDGDMDAQGQPLNGNNRSWDKSIFRGNKVTATVNAGSDMRHYSYPDTTNYVFDNRFYCNGNFRLDNVIPGYLYRRNNYFNDIPEKLFPCTGVSFPENEITVNYKKKMAALADVLPKNCTDPVLYTFSGGDELLTLGGHGKYTAKKDGTVKVTATCGSYDATQTIKIQLLPAPCETMYLSRKSVKTAVGRTTYIKGIYTPYWTTDILVFRSSDEEIFSITQDGEITAHKLGNAKIIATCGDKTAECGVQVVDVKELPVYQDGEWTLDNTVAYVPLPSVGENHTLYVKMKVDLDTILEDDGYVPLLDTAENAVESAKSPVSLAYQKLNGYPTYDWGTVDSETANSGHGTYRHVPYVSTGNFSEEHGAEIGFCFKPDGVYNLGAEVPNWEMLSDERDFKPYSGYLFFNVSQKADDAKLQSFANSAALKKALEAGNIHAGAAKGFKITQFILYSHDIYTTEEEIFKYREGADIDIRFDENGMPVNAGTSGALIWSSGNTQGGGEQTDEDTAKLGTGRLGKMRV